MKLPQTFLIISYLIISIQSFDLSEFEPFHGSDTYFVLQGSENTALSRFQKLIPLRSLSSFKKQIILNQTCYNNTLNDYNETYNLINNDINNGLNLSNNTIIPCTPIELKFLEKQLKKQEEDLPSWNLPIVVVAIPTFNRKDFLLQSLQYVKWQQYPRDRIHVAILDDSPESLENNTDFENAIEELEDIGITVHYKHRILYDNIQENIGQKRNSLVRWVRYEIDLEDESDYIIIHWDDDDWHAPHRIAKQVYPLINGQSELCALDLRTILLLHEDKVYYRWAPEGKNVHQAMPIMSVNGGTLAYWVSIWNETLNLRFPNLGCGEDIMFVDRIMNAKHRVTILDDSDISVIYMRHQGNTWSGLDPSSWLLLRDELLPPAFISVRNFYESMRNWKKPYWKGRMKYDEEAWYCSRAIDEIQTFVVNEIRGF